MARARAVSVETKGALEFLELESEAVVKSKARILCESSAYH